MKNIFYGMLKIENKKTEQIDYRITKIADSAFLAAYFVNLEIEKIKLDENFYFINYELIYNEISENTIEHLDPSYMYLFYRLKKKYKIDKNGKDLDYFFKLKFSNDVINYKIIPKNVMNELLDPNLLDKSEYQDYFAEYHIEINNTVVLSNFMKSSQYLNYAPNINKIVKLSEKKKMLEKKRILKHKKEINKITNFHD